VHGGGFRGGPFGRRTDDVTVLLISDNYKNMNSRILKTIATSGFLAALERTKFVFDRGSVPGPHWESLPRSPTPSSWFTGDPTFKGKGRGAEGRGGKRRGDAPPLTQISGSARGANVYETRRRSIAPLGVRVACGRGVSPRRRVIRFVE